MAFPRGYQWLLSLGLLLTGVSCRSVPTAPKSDPKNLDAQVQQAVTHIESGELALARTELTAVLQEAPRHPGALKVQTCLLLEQGALDEAATTVARLLAVNPEPPEVRVLAALVEQRRLSPAPGWREALNQAWKREGRPDLTESERFPLPRPETTTLVEKVWERTQSTETRFTAVLAESASQEQQRWLAEHLSELKDPDLLLSAYAYFLDRSNEEPLAEVRTQARETLKLRLGALAVESTGSQLPLLLLMGGTSTEAPLTQEELQALERIAALPRYRGTSLSHQYADAKRRLESAGVTPRGGSLLQAVVGMIAVDAPWRLYKRVGGTTDQLSRDERLRLGSALFTLGRRITEGTTLLERLLGLRQMAQGAELMGDEVKRAQVTFELEQARAIAGMASQLDVGTWPLPSLQQDWLKATVEDEWTHLSELAAP